MSVQIITDDLTVYRCNHTVAKIHTSHFDNPDDFNPDV